MREEKEGYVCPNCRMLFALSKGLGGHGANCPGCDELLTIPSAEDGVISQGVSKVSYQQAGLASQEFLANEGTKEGQWIESRRSEVSREEEDDQALRWMLPIGLLALLLLGGVSYFLLSSKDTSEEPVLANIENGEKEVEEVITFNHQDLDEKEKLKEYLDQLYGAKTIDTLLDHCRQSDGLREKMLKFYKGEKVPEQKIRRLTSSFDYGRIPGFFSYKAETTDYEIVQGLIEYKSGRFKLDWESNVGYSEMTWAELKKNKPTKPVILRVVVKQAEYYNLEFKDEKQWQSVTLSNPNELDGVLYAYVKKKSATEQQVSNFGMSNDGYAVTVKVHYTKNPQSDNQVIISEVVNDSWIQE